MSTPRMRREICAVGVKKMLAYRKLPTQEEMGELVLVPFCMVDGLVFIFISVFLFPMGEGGVGSLVPKLQYTQLTAVMIIFRAKSSATH